MKKAVTVRVDPDLLDAARACAAREHRSLANFFEMSSRGRIGERAGRTELPYSRRAAPQEESPRAD